MCISPAPKQVLRWGDVKRSIVYLNTNKDEPPLVSRGAVVPYTFLAFSLSLSLSLPFSFLFLSFFLFSLTRN